MPFLTERTYLNADRSKVVPADSPDAAYLLGGEGDEISAADAKKYGAKTRAEQSAEAPAKGKDEAKAESKPEPKAGK